jgi:hypothetical protein
MSTTLQSEDLGIDETAWGSADTMDQYRRSTRAPRGASNGTSKPISPSYCLHHQVHHRRMSADDVGARDTERRAGDFTQGRREAITKRYGAAKSYDSFALC